MNLHFLEGLKRGFAVVCMNYRLSDEAQFPKQIYDCKAAVRYLRANAEKYHLDVDRIAAWGASAGAHLAALLGTSRKGASSRTLPWETPRRFERGSCGGGLVRSDGKLPEDGRAVDRQRHG